jgi:hypothetical protein
VGVEISAAGVFGIPAVVVDVGDTPSFAAGGVTAPGDACVVPDFCAPETSLAPINFFWRAICKSSCRKSSPEDCRLRGGFDSFWPEDVEMRGAEAEVCTGVLTWGVGTLCDWETCATPTRPGDIDRPWGVKLADGVDGVTEVLSGTFWDD